MPAPIDEIVKRRVVQQWLAGEAREKIIADNDIAAGTVLIIVDEYKVGLDNFELDSFRELTIQARKRGISSSDLASFFRLYNFFRGSGAKENEIESFITNINSGYITPGKAIELVNQIHDISKSESVSPDQLPGYIKQKLEEKKQIDEEIRQADTILQTKNVKSKTINEYTKLNEKLNRQGLSTQDVNKLVKLEVNANKHGFDTEKIVGKLSNIERLEKRKKGLEKNCTVLSKWVTKYTDIIPFTEELVSLRVGIPELIGLDVGIKEAAKMYNSSFFDSTVRLIDDIKKYNKIDGLKKELSALYMQKYTLDQVCSSQNKSMRALINLQSRGITEDQLILSNNHFGEQ